ncbi:MAG TPA: dephospho-CoA kinase [Xanthomonadales bacterium]|nr:dephospho-CoA kinase [Xanthomonadales bacterium]
MAAGPYVVAVTGGVASGKSTVTDGLAAYGVPVIDADVVARDLVEPGEPALAEILAEFGDELAGPGGRLDRRALRAIVFADPAKRRALEAILHPRVERRMRELVERFALAPYVVLAIPLLAEVGRYDFIDRVVVVDAPEDAQLERLVRRDAVTREQAAAMLAAQTDRAARLGIADAVVPNDGTLAQLRARIDALHADLLARAAARA